MPWNGPGLRKRAIRCFMWSTHNTKAAQMEELPAESRFSAVESWREYFGDVELNVRAEVCFTLK